MRFFQSIAWDKETEDDKDDQCMAVASSLCQLIQQPRVDTQRVMGNLNALLGSFGFDKGEIDVTLLMVVIWKERETIGPDVLLGKFEGFFVDHFINMASSECSF